MADTHVRSLLCLLGRHRWELHRYWAISNQLAEGRVCRDCKATHPDRRIVGR